jgi:hypothetical protein
VGAPVLSRRQLFQVASGLLVPMPEPARAYSFVGGWHGYRITNLAPPRMMGDAAWKADFDRGIERRFEIEWLTLLYATSMLDGTAASDGSPRDLATFINSRAGTGRKKPL